MPYTWLDWRFFYTSNVSMKKTAVADWSTEGFSKAFPLAGFEDAEFAYRLNRRRRHGFRILYVPAATAVHRHSYSVRQFMARQVSVGMMANIMLELHPDIDKEIGLHELRRRLALPPGVAAPVQEFLSVIEGIKGWAGILETQYQLGTQNWHTDLLTALFEMCYLQGYIMAHDNPAANHAEAYKGILERFQQRMSHSIAIEAFGHMPAYPLV
jgi:hypothetical protein